MDILRALREGAQLNADSFALLSLERVPLTYPRLLTHCYRVIADLNQAGISRGDRVAVVLPNGPEMAACVVAIAMGASCAPLNPNYRRSEFEFYLSDLAPRALIVQESADLPAIAVAESLGMRVIRLRPSTADAAGIFTLDLPPAPANATPVFAQPGDEALVLHTSGTTARPKMVPLTHSNLAATIDNIIATLALTPRDRCLNVMPLFHVNGMIGVVFASLAAGASVVCAPGFYAPHFFEWCREFAPTWYSAVPAMHQSILARTREHPEWAASSTFRFIRSGAAPLAPVLMAELERVFQVPVIEGYGLTETAQQVSVNPLPPCERKPGSVGIPGQTEIGIIGEDGELLGTGQTGEIVARGPAVMTGYANNPIANRESFINGWFRTGDQGRLDADGYLYVTGRIKEIINRGGQKISPSEIDEVICAHPAVAQAVTFPVPDSRLGEDIAAVVVLNSRDAITKHGLRSFVAERVADFKVPRQIYFVDRIPTGPSGKVRRIELSALLGIVGSDSPELPARGPYVAPASETEKALTEIWTGVLGVDHIGINDDFVSLGGDSLLLAQLVLRLHESGWRKISILTFFDRPTIAGLAELIDSEGKDSRGYADESSRVLSVQPQGSRTPIFMVRGFTIFSELSRLLGTDQPIYALLDPEMMDLNPPYDFVGIARRHVRTILAVRPHGPYVIGGFSAGGPLAYEVAQQLIESGHEVALLVLFDSSCPVQPSVSWARRKGSNVRIHLRELRAMRVEKYSTYLAPVLARQVEALRSRIRAWTGGDMPGVDQPSSEDRDPPVAFQDASRSYRPQPYHGRAILFKRTKGISSRFVLPDCGWGAFINRLHICVVPGDHFAMFVEPGVAILADRLRSILDDVSAERPPRDASRSIANAAYESYESAPGRIDAVARQHNGSVSGESSPAAVSNGRSYATSGNREASISHWPIQPLGKRPPLYVMGSFKEFIPLAWRLGLDQPVLGVAVPNELKLRMPYRLEEFAAAQVESILKYQTSGPYFLAGFSAEGVLAFEVARQLTAKGSEMGLVVLVDSACPAEPDPLLTRMTRNARIHITQVLKGGIPQLRLNASGILRRLVLRMRIQRWRFANPLRIPVSRPAPRDPMDVVVANVIAARSYVPQPYSGRVLLFKRTMDLIGRYRQPDNGWGRVVRDGLEVHRIEGDHLALLAEPGVDVLAEKLAEAMGIKRDERMAQAVVGF
jgi:oxalate---CoA ligase